MQESVRVVEMHPELSREFVVHPPRMHLANLRRWWVGSSSRPTTARRGSKLGMLELSAHAPRADTPSTTDALIADSARQLAQGELGRASRRAARLARRADRLASRSARLRTAAEGLAAALVRGPAGGAEEPSTMRARHDRLDSRIDEETDRGDRTHRRVGRGQRIAARVLPWIDALLFGYFVAGVSNANLTRPLTTPVASLVALGFTVFLVLSVAVFTPWLGRRLRDHKGTDGEPCWAEVGASLGVLLGLWAILTSAIGVTMFVRVQAEAGYAGAGTGTALTVAVLLALAAVALNAFVLVTAYCDGSAAADDLRHRARVLRRTERKVARLRARAQRSEGHRERLVRRARLLEARALVRAGSRLAAGERTIDLVRLRTGTPAGVPRPDPIRPDDLDLREVSVIRAALATPPEV